MKLIVAATTHPAKDDDLLLFIKYALFQGVEQIHFDVMDGKYVKDIASGANEIKALRHALPDAYFAVHVMAEKPIKLSKKIMKAKPQALVFQIEPEKNERKVIKTLKKWGKKTKAGIAIDLNTKIEDISEEVFKNCKTVLVMCVKAGKSGQPFVFGALSKIQEINEKYPHIEIIADGGINEQNAKTLLVSGADIIAVGSAMYNIIKQGKAKKFIDNIKKLDGIE